VKKLRALISRLAKAGSACSSMWVNSAQVSDDTKSVINTPRPPGRSSSTSSRSGIPVSAALHS